MPTVTGDVKRIAGTTVTSGEVRFTATTPVVQDPSGKTTSLATSVAEHVVPLDGTGTFSTTLPATGDTWVYRVEISAYVGGNRVQGLPRLLLEVPASGADLSDAGVEGAPSGRVVVNRLVGATELSAAVAPIQQTADNALTTAQDAVDTVEAIEGPISTRLGALEVLGGLEPGDVSDATVQNLITQEGTGTRTALNAATVQIVNPRSRLVVGTGSGSTDRAELAAVVQEAATAGAPVSIRGNFQLTGGTISPTTAVEIDARDAVFTQLDVRRPAFMLPSKSRMHGGRIIGKGDDWENSSAVYGASGVVIANGASDVTVDSIRVENMAGAGVDARVAGEGLRVLNCILRGPGSSIIPASTGQYGGGLVANNLTDFNVSGGKISGFAQGIVTGAVDRFYVGAGLEVSSVGQHGIYLGSARAGTISGARIIGVPLQGIKSQISDATPDHSSLLTIGDCVIRDNGSHAILLTNTQATPTSKHQRVSVHHIDVDHGSGSGDTVHLQHVSGATISDIESKGGNVGLRITRGTWVDAHHMHFALTQRSGVRAIDTTDSKFESIRVTDGSTLDDVADRFGFFVTGAASARLRFVGNTVADAANRTQYGYYLAAGDLSSMVMALNDSTGVDYGYRSHATANTKLFIGNTLAGTVGTFFNAPPNAVNVVDTSGATLLQLEAEVNKVKQRLRDIKAYNV